MGPDESEGVVSEPDYHIALDDETRLHVEQWGYEYERLHGKPMPIPPRLYSDMKSGGVNMRHFVADGRLDMTREQMLAPGGPILDLGWREPK